ncbi:hypothetical protein WMY93_009713 [Mugilogobius chulae]|uniref:Ig-like domain-containing protein n=1 Tax=Mugilogobius chulae TaxID=88201 RepID=A0AAW0PCC1_9GOBI
MDSAPSTSILPSNCTRKTFNVDINASGSAVEEAETVTLICEHDLPETLNVTYKWRKEEDTIESKDKQYIIKRTFSEHVGQYYCVVQSECGNYTSDPHDVTIHNNNLIILVICGCAAFGLVAIMGTCMKIKMHRDKVRHQQRTKERVQQMQRAHELQNRGPQPNQAQR